MNVNSYIGHLHHQYQLVGGVTGGVTARLDRLAHDRLAQALTVALEQALGDDPTVYVLRQVQARLILPLHAQLTDARLIQAWAERLTGAIVRQLAQTSNDATQQICFTDQADYIATYVVDLLKGQATHQWYYHALRRYHEQPTPAAVRTVLLDNRPHLPAILGKLYERGAIPQLLACLEPLTVQALWCDGLGAPAVVDPAASYPLFALALQLIDRLALWQHGVPNPEPLFHSYLAEAPSPVDWRDRAALTATVIEVLHFLHRRGHLHWPTVNGAAFADHLDQLLRDFDWLDVEQLRAALLHRESTAPHAASDLPARRAGPGVPPRQRRLIDDLVAALAQSPLRLIHHPLPALANALHLYALLVHAAPQWADDPLALQMIRQLLEACHWLSQSERPDDLIHQLRRRDHHRALQAIPAASQPVAATALHWLAALGDSGCTVAATLVDSKPAPSAAPVVSQPLQATGVIQALILLAALDAPALHLIKRLLKYWTHLSAADREMIKERLSGKPGNAAPTSPVADQTPRIEFHHALVLFDEPSPALTAALGQITALDAVAISTLNELLHNADPLTAAMQQGIQSACAGLYLLLRAIADVRLPGLVNRVEYPPAGAPTPLTALLLALGLRWAGIPAAPDGQLDLGLAPLTGGQGRPTLAALRAAWVTATPADHARFQQAFLQILAGQRLVRGAVLHVHQVTLADGNLALIAGDESGQLWPLGSVLDGSTTGRALADDWLEAWQAAVGVRPQLVVSADLADELADLPGMVVVETEATAVAATHAASRQALAEALAALAQGQLAVPAADLTVALTAIALLRVWARWLPRFAAASVPYLLQNFIRRTGCIVMDARTLQVTLDSLPLDVVLTMAGYTAPLEKLIWLEERTVHFTLASFAAGSVGTNQGNIEQQLWR